MAVALKSFERGLITNPSGLHREINSTSTNLYNFRYGLVKQRKEINLSICFAMAVQKIIHGCLVVCRFWKVVEIALCQIRVASKRDSKIRRQYTDFWNLLFRWK